MQKINKSHFSFGSGFFKKSTVYWRPPIWSLKGKGTTTVFWPIATLFGKDFCCSHIVWVLVSVSNCKHRICSYQSSSRYPTWFENDETIKPATQKSTTFYGNDERSLLQVYKPPGLEQKRKHASTLFQMNSRALGSQKLPLWTPKKGRSLHGLRWWNTKEGKSSRRLS